MGAVNLQQTQLVDYMFTRMEESKVWDVLVDTLEAKRFARFMLKDVSDQLEKL